MAGVKRSGEEEELAALSRLDAFLDEELEKKQKMSDPGLPDSYVEEQLREEGEDG